MVDTQRWVDDIGNLANERNTNSVEEIARQIGLNNDELEQILKVAADYQFDVPHADHVYGATIAGIFIGIKWAKEQHEKDWKNVLEG